MSWMDFNTAEEQNDIDIIPAKTLAKVHLKIRPGAFDDPAKGWTGGYATRSDHTGAVYLDCEFTIIGGKFNKRKVWTLVGLESPKGPKWGDMGRSFIRGALESAKGIRAHDASDAAMNARKISGLGDLNGLEFVAQIDVETQKGGDYDGQKKNVIKNAVSVSHKDYATLMGGGAAAPATSANPPATGGQGGMPSWATE